MSIFQTESYLTKEDAELLSKAKMEAEIKLLSSKSQFWSELAIGVRQVSSLSATFITAIYEDAQRRKT